MGLRDLIFSRKSLPARESQEQMERLLVEGFRTLGKFCSDMAERMEALRLQRGGYRAPGEFLERLDPQRPAGTAQQAPPLRSKDHDPS